MFFFAVYDDDDNNGEFESLKRKFYQQLKGKFPEFQKEQTFDMKIIKGPSINLNRVPRPYFNMGVGECVLTDTLSFPLIPNILFYCVQTVFTNR